MRNLKYIFAAAVIFISSGLSAYANEENNTRIPFPFQNIALSPHGSLQTGYTFRESNGNVHPLIICLQSTGQATLTWPYKGNIQSGDMPITITNNANYEGSFADMSGTLTITNNATVQSFVSCQYAF